MEFVREGEREIYFMVRINCNKFYGYDLSCDSICHQKVENEKEEPVRCLVSTSTVDMLQN